MIRKDLTKRILYIELAVSKGKSVALKAKGGLPEKAILKILEKSGL